MIPTFWMMLQAVTAPQSLPLPNPLSDQHIGDIGCIATLGLVADEQRRGVAAARRFPDVTGSGRTFAGIVGDRVVFETGQPVPVIALAIRRAVEERQRLFAAAPDQGKDRNDIMDGLMADCLIRLAATTGTALAAEPEEKSAK